MNMILSRKRNSNNIRQTKQQGSALILALFIIIVLTLLGGTLVKILSTSSETIAQEVIGTRALMAANSAMQAELAVLFPLNAISTCPDEPASRQTSPNFANIDGLYNCEAKTSCSLYHMDANNIKYYRLTSTGECGSSVIGADSKAVVRSSRTIQVEARSL
jgi:MSHA biogenesis protein MshP